MLGFETNDDAAVYRLSDEIAAVLTADFFTPLIDDPYEFGRIAAANALSDIFAMGARPLMAINLLAISPDLGMDLVKDILRGGADAVSEAGALIAGGHTIHDHRPKYGLSVLGTVHPEKLIRNDGAQPGDLLYLTKALGTDIMTAALEAGEESQSDYQVVIESMMELNALASEAMRAANAHAATDITGYGLAGHLHELLVASACSADLEFSQIPLFDRAAKYFRQLPPRGLAVSNKNYVMQCVEQDKLDDSEFDYRLRVLSDPQTSGGLLIALAPEEQAVFEESYHSLTGKQAACVGVITPSNTGCIRLT